ncbi:MAG: hypothetical protein HY508_07355 [Acidobacteria bacterium]|nr:hypothetical protein [Acidobacteriota bacterium]
MRKVGLLILVGAMTGIGLLAHEGHRGKTKIVGEVIDTVCYVSHDSRGPEHAECARDCARQGISLGILEEKTGRVFISLPIDHSSPNAKLLDHVARRVEAVGTVYSKGGLRGIFVESVRALPARPSTSGSKQ